MRRLMLFVVCAVLGQLIHGQITISGKVKDNKGRPVNGASIAIKDSYDGATSDSLGNYHFKTSEKGEHLLLVSSVGYKLSESKINISGSPILLDLILKEEPNELTAVVISAGTFEASDRKRAAAVLNPIDIVTTASANADVTMALKTLPGAQQVGETEGLFVRGGTAGETRIFIDGTLVNKFFHSTAPNIAGYGRFSPFIFKGTVFSTGGYSALYGQALSSAVILESIDLPERTSANLGFSVLNAGGGYQHLSKKKNASWGLSYDYTNLALAFAIIKQKQDYFRVPSYHTAEGNFRIKTSKTGMLKYYGSFSSGRFGFTVPSIDSLDFKDLFKLKNFYLYHNLSWKENLGSGWRFSAGISYSNNKDDINSGMQDRNKQDVTLAGLEFKNFVLDTRGNYFNAKGVFEKRLRGISAIRFGSEYNLSNDRSVFTLYTGENFRDTVNEHIKSFFAEGDIYITNGLAAKLGTRLEHSSLFNEYSLAPRISLAYKIGKQGQASLAYGVFYQNPERRYLPSSYPLTFSKATHYIAQYQKTTNLKVFRAEIFYKKYKDLIKTGFYNGRSDVAINNNGYGDAKGFDFFWRDKKTLKNVDYWISYSYLDTKRDFLNYPAEINPSFASKHTASVVVKKFVMKLKTQFNASYTFATGRPYYNIRYDDTDNKFKIFDQGKTIPYNSMSFSVNYLPNINSTGANKFTVLVLSVNNIFNSKQVFGYQYSYNGLRKEAIVPPSRMFVFLGVFMSFGIDRSQDVIDSTL